MRTLVFGFLLALTVGLPELSATAAAPVVPDASECQADSQRSVMVLFATPVSADATPIATLPPIASAGPPADAESVAAVTATARAVVACLNAGDFLSLMSFVSDGYLRRSFVDGVPTDPLALDLERFVNALRGCEECEVDPLEGDDRFAIAAITNVRVLDDGRVGADLTLTNPSGTWSDWLVVAFVASEDRWLVDQIIEVDSEGTSIDE
jgi:hypothetical protein